MRRARAVNSSSRVDVAQRKTVFEASARRCRHFEGQRREESTDVNISQRPASVHRSNDGGGDDVAWAMGGGKYDGSRQRETKSDKIGRQRQATKEEVGEDEAACRLICLL
jgi:hypothetical protein